MTRETSVPLEIYANLDSGSVHHYNFFNPAFSPGKSLEYQEIRSCPRNTEKPVRDLLCSVASPAQSASLKAAKCKSPQPKPELGFLTIEPPSIGLLSIEILKQSSAKEKRTYISRNWVPRACWRATLISFVMQTRRLFYGHPFFAIRYLSTPKPKRVSGSH